MEQSQRQNQRQKQSKEIINSSPMGPATGIQTPEEKKREQEDRSNVKQPAAPGDTV